MKKKKDIIQIIPILANNIYFYFFIVISVYSQEQWGWNRKLSYLNLLGELLRTVPSRIREKFDQRTAQITKMALTLSCSVCINNSNSLEESPSNCIAQGGVGEVEVAGSGLFGLSQRGKQEQGSCPRSKGPHEDEHLPELQLSITLVS